MIGKKPIPVIGNLNTGKLESGSNKYAAGPTSPTSPLEFKILSPRRLRTYYVGGVGLGILAALEKSGPEIPTKNSFCCRNFNRSDPIPVNADASDYNSGILEGVENGTDSFEEELTYVTWRNSSKPSTRVYRDGYKYSRKESRVSRKNNGGGCIFDISPARFCDSTPYHGTDFLSSCNLCKKKLHGKDVYMYRGEKAFCSRECRYRQIINDERQEKCRAEC